MRRSRSRGLTLLEVLISIVVLVLAVSTILPLFAVGSASHKRGMDQAQMAWLAPRVAARIQDRFYDTNPGPIKGFVRELEDGSLLIDDGGGGKLADDGGAAFRFEATFTPISGRIRGSSWSKPTRTFTVASQMDSILSRRIETWYASTVNFSSGLWSRIPRMSNASDASAASYS